MDRIAEAKKKFGGLGVPELRQLEEENQQLKQQVADLSLDNQMLRDVIKKKLQCQPRSGGWPKA